MTTKRGVVLLVVAFTVGIVIAGCGQGTGSHSKPKKAEAASLSAATLGEQTVLSTSEYLRAPPYAGADRENGLRQAQFCRACHSLEEEGRHMIGPNLSGLFGSASGTKDGFDYSDVMRDAEFVWTPRALDAWLVAPAQFLPGNRMSFMGVADPGNRADLIAYLLVATE